MRRWKRQGYFWVLCVGALLLPGEPAVAAPQLGELLLRTGRYVESFWVQVASFASTEVVTQEKINKKGKSEFKTDTTNDYLAITKADEEGLTIEELRLPQTKGSNKSNPPSLLSTNGFPTLLLAFHPRYQANYHFQIANDGKSDGGSLAIYFKQISGMKSTCALVLQERIYPLALHGTAWIDTETGAIRKIAAALISPLNDINIKALDVDVTYKLQVLSSGSESRWLPSTAVINIQTALQQWRNTHRYSQYKRFTVELTESALR